MGISCPPALTACLYLPATSTTTASTPASPRPPASAYARHRSGGLRRISTLYRHTMITAADLPTCFCPAAARYDMVRTARAVLPAACIRTVGAG